MPFTKFEGPARTLMANYFMEQSDVYGAAEFVMDRLEAPELDGPGFNLDGLYDYLVALARRLY